MVPDKEYSVKEWSRVLGLHRTTVYRWIKEGKVQAYKINKRMGWRIITIPKYRAVYDVMDGIDLITNNS